MKIVITGGGGFIGSRLAKALLARGTLAAEKIARLTLVDQAFPAGLPGDPRLTTLAGDISDPKFAARAIAPDTASVFHLAAVVSGAAEADFDLGMRVNLQGMRNVLEQARKCVRPPRFVFASSVAAFGGDLPEVLDDSTTPAPQTSYGSQKVIGEYLVSDFSRKGYVDGRSLRLPTIVVRPGKANAAASSFASAVVREPLNGIAYECPLPPETGVWLLSPRRVVEAFIHAHDLPTSRWGSNRVVNLPGITVTVAEMIAAMGKIAGSHVAKRVSWKPDARIDAIVKTWPVRFATTRAFELGFKADPGIEAVIRDYITDENVKVV
ncbi:MAG: NAD-dependent epimerase/dehydratase family protein [Betaproteobacteria bacterium]|nr:MAG: NAD-dependent epimerase/dehydratase family protein [Betaproteobacteria bacterium]